MLRRSFLIPLCIAFLLVLPACAVADTITVERHDDVGALEGVLGSSGGGNPSGGNPGGGSDPATPPATNPTPPVGTIDGVAPTTSLAGKSKQDIGGGSIAISVLSSEAGSASVSGQVNVPGAGRIVKFNPAGASLTGGKRTTVKLKLSKKNRDAVRDALADGRKLKARVTVTVTDAAGNAASAKRSIGLTDRRVPHPRGSVRLTIESDCELAGAALAG